MLSANRQKPFGEFGGLITRIRDLLHVFVDGSPWIELLEHQLAITVDHREQIVKVVCDSTRQTPDAVQAMGLLQFLLHRTQFGHILHRPGVFRTTGERLHLSDGPHPPHRPIRARNSMFESDWLFARHRFLAPLDDFFMIAWMDKSEPTQAWFGILPGVQTKDAVHLVRPDPFDDITCRVHGHFKTSKIGDALRRCERLLALSQPVCSEILFGLVHHKNAPARTSCKILVVCIHIHFEHGPVLFPVHALKHTCGARIREQPASRFHLFRQLNFEKAIQRELLLCVSVECACRLIRQQDPIGFAIHRKLRRRAAFEQQAIVLLAPRKPPFGQPSLRT